MALPDSLVLVRHGFSEANLAQKIQKNDRIQEAHNQGSFNAYKDAFYERHDSRARLTEIGVNQAQTAGEWLKTNHPEFTRFFVSPHIRTRETAAHLALGGNWVLDDLWRERDWGEYGAVSLEQQHEMFATSTMLKDQSPWYWCPPGGESLATGVRSRVNTLLNRLEKLPEGETVIAVTHGELIRTAQFVIEQLTPDEWLDIEDDKKQNIKNCTILHYTRLNPDTNERYHRYKWARQINPVDPNLSPNGGAWREISGASNPFPKFSDKELLATVENYPRIFNGNELPENLI